MFEGSTSIWSYTALGIYVLWAIIILIVFRLIIRFLPALRASQKSVKGIRRWLGLVELFVWTVLFTVAADQFAESSPVLSLLLLSIAVIIIIAIGWFFLRDVISGTFVRTAGFITKGDFLDTGKHSGKVVQLRTQGLYLESGDNSMIYIPYSKIIGKAISRTRSSDNRIKRTFRFSIPWQKAEIHELVEEAERLIYLAPNISTADPPEIRIEEKTDDVVILKISLYLINPDRDVETKGFFLKELGKGTTTL